MHIQAWRLGPKIAILSQVKTDEKDGYSAVQVGYQVCKEKRITKPELYHLRKVNAPAMKTLVEFRVSLTQGLEAEDREMVLRLCKRCNSTILHHQSGTRPPLSVPSALLFQEKSRLQGAVKLVSAPLRDVPAILLFSENRCQGN